MQLKMLQGRELRNKVAVVLGTRPEIIKLGPVIRALQQSKQEFFVIHTGQHYSAEMDRQFFEDLQLPRPQFTNDSFRNSNGGLTHGRQTAEIINFVEGILIKERPRCLVVEGDTNTVLAAALVARKLGIAVAHVEAGLRSRDWRMPEEHNRVMVDHISEFLFPPTNSSRDNLRKENVQGTVQVVGNTIADAVEQNLTRALKRQILKQINFDHGQPFFLLTVHREENVDNLKTVRNFRQVLESLADRFALPMLFPVHPRTRNRLQLFQEWEHFQRIPGLHLLDPVGYLDFLALISLCRMVFTDSGGVQEEACILKVPCVTLRDSTERPETVQVGANIVAGMDPESVGQAAKRMLQRKRNWRSPYGRGDAAVRIVAALQKFLRDARVCRPSTREPAKSKCPV